MISKKFEMLYWIYTLEFYKPKKELLHVQLYYFFRSIDVKNILSEKLAECRSEVNFKNMFSTGVPAPIDTLLLGLLKNSELSYVYIDQTFHMLVYFLIWTDNNLYLVPHSQYDALRQMNRKEWSYKVIQTTFNLFNNISAFWSLYKISLFKKF